MSIIVWVKWWLQAEHKCVSVSVSFNEPVVTGSAYSSAVYEPGVNVVSAKQYLIKRIPWARP